jgi:hypothetical protein
MKDKTIIGTSYFPTFDAAKAYYSRYFMPDTEPHTTAYEVDLQLREYVRGIVEAEQIHIGEPPHDYTKGERIEIVNENPGRRYHLICNRLVETRTQGDIVYELRWDGGDLKLYTVGEHGYECGYVSSQEYMQDAIDNHEEEMRIMFAEAREEFGI